MIRLVRVELTRLRWRRAVVVLAALPILFAFLMVAIRAYDTRPVSDAERADAQVAIDEQLVFQQEELERCLDDPEYYGATDEDGEPDPSLCEEYSGAGYEPRLEDYLARYPLDLAEEREGTGLAVVAILAVLLLLIGTTYVGHDWNTGSMSNQLLFDPRRLRVWGAKAIAVGLLAAVLSVVVLTIFWGGMLLLAGSRDIDTPSAVTTDIWQQSGRSVAMAVIAALSGYALTSLSRSTVFTIGALAIVAVAGGLFFALLPAGAQAYEPATNAAALVSGKVEYYVDVPPTCFEGEVVFDESGEPDVEEGSTCDQTREFDATHGAVYYAVLMTLLGVASAASYRRRDLP